MDQGPTTNYQGLVEQVALISLQVPPPAELVTTSLQAAPEQQVLVTTSSKQATQVATTSYQQIHLTLRT